MRVIPMRLVAGLLAAVAMLAAPAITRAQVLGDSVVASGDTAASFTNIDINVASGPSGENPTGHAAATLGAERFKSASITCLSVSGNTAVVGGSLEPNSVGLAGFVETLVDNGPADSGLDTFTAIGTSAVPTVCPSPDPLGNTLTTGDIVVVDVPPLPTSKDQCTNGGWQTYGVFKNKGGCVSFVATEGKNPPGKKAG